MTRATRPSARGAGGEGAAIEAVERAARVLFALGARGAPSTLAEIAIRAELSKPTTFRILATLIAEGLAAQNAQTGAYRLGATPLRFGASVLRAIPVREPALAEMRRVRDRVNETVVLSLREGDFRYNIETVEAEHAIGQAQMIGVAIPLYAGAASRVLLAGMESEEFLSYIDRVELKAIAGGTIVDRQGLVVEISQTINKGYAVSNGEISPSGHAVAKAIRDPRGRAIAALHVAAPRSRFSTVVEQRCVVALGDAVAAIEAALPQQSI